MGCGTMLAIWGVTQWWQCGVWHGCGNMGVGRWWQYGVWRGGHHCVGHFVTDVTILNILSKFMNNIFISIKGIKYTVNDSDMLITKFCMSHKFSNTREPRGAR